MWKRLLLALWRLGCWIFGHNYQVAQELTNHSRRIICPTCRSDWGMNDNTRSLIQWDNELESMYRDVFGLVIFDPWRTT